MKIELTIKEKNLIKEILKDYENKVYINIDKKENKWLFKLIDKFN